MWVGAWICLSFLQMISICVFSQTQGGEDSCQCPNTFKPLCASDGRTYTNECYFNCMRQKSIYKPIKKHDGVCTDADKHNSCYDCPSTVQPVCGTDDRTYFNECILRCMNRDKKVNIKHIGPCQISYTMGRLVGQPNKPSCESKCPSTFRPLCGTDGVTYMNDCLFYCKREDPKVTNKPWKAHDGVCTNHDRTTKLGHSVGDVLCYCPVDFKPICATNGETYQNPCYFECARERSSRKIWKNHDGICIHRNSAPSSQLRFDLCGCSLKHEPVCGTDKKTYKNICFLQCQRFLHDFRLWLDYEGECKEEQTQDPLSKQAQPVDVCNCPHYYAPVCGSDGKTYQNECSLQCVRLFTDHTLWKVIDGECVSNEVRTWQFSERQCDCGWVISPVCGSDNRTYRSECVLQCVRIFYPELQKIYDGECKPDMTVSTGEEQDACTKECLDLYNPICGYDGKHYQTFNNYCYFYCKHLKVPEMEYSYHGECKPSLSSVQEVGKSIEEACNCTKEYPPFSPRCAYDGRGYWMYNNKCLLKCAMRFFPKLRPAKMEECWYNDDGNIVDNNLQADPEVCKCTLELSPVCGFDGSGYYIYRNKCFLQCAQTIFTRLKQVKMEDCPYLSKSGITEDKLPDESSCFCENEYLPICGSDGTKYITYQNLCVFKCMKLKYPKLEVVHNGQCLPRATDKTEADCAESEAGPVCGYDGQEEKLKTFRNYCAFKSEIKENPKLSYIHDGECKSRIRVGEDESEIGDLCICSQKYEPVCASNGTNYITYYSYCNFQCHKLKYPRLRLVHEGACISKLKTSRDDHKPKSICSCPNTFHQVCGTDGVTYQNPCYLQCQKIYYSYELQMDYDGRCQFHKDSNSADGIIEYEPPIILGCACPSEVAPVCGSDGKTYRNMCKFDCEKSHYNPILWLAYMGKCRGKNPRTELQEEQGRYSCNCTTYYQPLCGSDGRTYLNDCYFGCQTFFDHGLWKIHDGECFFTHANTKILLPKPEANRLCKCTNEFQPVCGTDWRTYLNDCYLQCIMPYHRALSKLHDGECTFFHEQIFASQIQTEGHKKEANSCFCTTKFAPVCGTDLKTYLNECVLQCVKSYKTGLTKLHDGKCVIFAKDIVSSEQGQESTKRPTWAWACNCPEKYEPVCGSDGITYSNVCYLECSKYFCDDIIWKNHDGKCKNDGSNDFEATLLRQESVPVDLSCYCPKICKPVCGSDGKTYVNECQMVCRRNKELRELYKLHDGYCL